MKKLENVQMEKINGGEYGWPISPSMLCWIATVLIFQGILPEQVEAGVTISNVVGCAS